MRDGEGVSEGVRDGVPVSEEVREGDSVSEGVRDREGVGDCVSEEDPVTEDVLVEEGAGVSVSEEVRVGVFVEEGVGDPVSEDVREEDPVAEGDADAVSEVVSDGEGVGDTATYEIEKTGSPCAFVAMSMGLVNWMSVVVFAGTATPVDVKSMYTHWFSWPHHVRPHSEKPPLIDWACASHPLAVQHWVLYVPTKPRMEADPV